MLQTQSPLDNTRSLGVLLQQSAGLGFGGAGGEDPRLIVSASLDLIVCQDVNHAPDRFAWARSLDLHEVPTGFEVLTKPLDTARPGDTFVLFLFARDRGRPGVIEEVAVGVIDAEYKAYLLYEPVDSFLADYAPNPVFEPAPKDPGSDSAPLVRLRRGRKAFKPPETLEQDKSDESGGAGA